MSGALVSTAGGLGVLVSEGIIVGNGAALGPFALWMGLATIAVVALVTFGVLSWSRRGLPKSVRLLDQVAQKPGTQGAFITLFQADAKRAFRRRMNVRPDLRSYIVVSGTDDAVTFWTTRYGERFAALVLPRDQIDTVSADRDPSLGLLADAYAVWFELVDPSARFSLLVMTASKRGWPRSATDLPSVREVAEALSHSPSK